ncbi:hypothetical protein DENIS_0936 [Desulfonema ishimotonii]|uniref:Uncharacterized protein n=1 Tax=Desulfonema ishimotonii TaxID=45657 RepID=A0A401FSP7_9BACT|nr:hypothetical protein [Desulfonema ishimotonii]GBC59994.1 hypothetical protein DENIS_0936 [Desulfonema ishimotonii]
MEPVTLIIGALAAGATAAAKDTASQAVKDAYNGLKSLIQKQFADKGNAEGEMALTKYEEKPAVWEEPLKDSLVETGADKSPDIRTAVDTLKQALEAMPEGEKVLAKYNIQNCDVGIIGDHARIEGGIHIGGKK